MQTSARGVATIEHEEGVVLRAYLCPAHRWTIGAGLTAASGVVVPKAGMVITHDEASRLLTLALRKNYEPAVQAEMPMAVQHEFDAGVSFHFNTGAIRRATWVKRWRAKVARAAIRASLMQWTKGGGKVLPGLVKRREREAGMLFDGVYPVWGGPVVPKSPAANDLAVWASNIDLITRAKATAEFAKLGYPPDVLTDALSSRTIRQFQRDHGLTVDGIIGRATLSTLQRRLDAAAKAKPAAAAAVVAPAAPATSAADSLSLPPAADWIIVALILLWGAWIAFRYRDAIAAKITKPLPRLAAFLRSF